MAKVVYKSYNPNDNLLLPPCLGDYLPQNHPARVVSAIIDHLDISEIESGYVGGGTSSYNPGMLLKVIVYSYAKTASTQEMCIEAAGRLSINIHHAAATLPGHLQQLLRQLRMQTG